MLRHKAMIQCARLAFGYGGIFDHDEAERIVEATTVDATTGEIRQASVPARPALESYPSDRFQANLPKWQELVVSGQKTPADIEAMLSSKAALSEEQRRDIRNLGVIDVPTFPNDPEVDQFIKDME